VTVRSKALKYTQNLSTTSAVVYTASSGETVLVKRVVIYNRHATNAATVTVSMGATAGATNNGTHLRETLQPQTCIDREVWWVLQPGIPISAIASANTSLTISLYGAELEGVAD